MFLHDVNEFCNKKIIIYMYYRIKENVTHRYTAHAYDMYAGIYFVTLYYYNEVLRRAPTQTA